MIPYVVVVVVQSVSAWIYCTFSLVVSAGFDLVFSVVARRLAGKSVSNMTHFVSSGMLNFTSVSQ